MSLQAQWESAMHEYDTSLEVVVEAEHALERATQNWNLAVTGLRAAGFATPAVEDGALALVRARGVQLDAAREALRVAMLKRDWRYEQVDAADVARHGGYGGSGRVGQDKQRESRGCVERTGADHHAA